MVSQAKLLYHSPQKTLLMSHLIAQQASSCKKNQNNNFLDDKLKINFIITLRAWDHQLRIPGL